MFIRFTLCLQQRALHCTPAASTIHQIGMLTSAERRELDPCTAFGSARCSSNGEETLTMTEAIDRVAQRAQDTTSTLCQPSRDKNLETLSRYDP
jgi:hypothetical protein